MFPTFLRYFWFVVFLLIAPTGAWAEKRVALVIGNSVYSHVARLTNPTNDANRLAETLKSIGFDKVRLELDLTQTELRRVLGSFSRDAAGADIALIYFAGHGIEVAGTNYIIPVDASLTHVDDVEFETVELSKLMHSLGRAGKLKLVILDACRNNPFKNRMVVAGVSRSIGRGLARVNPPGSDTLVAYAAKEGTVAADGNGKNSPYAQALIKHISTPGLDVRLLFGRVRDEVLASTGRRQEPFTYGSLGGDVIYLKPPEPKKLEGTSTQRERIAWAFVKNSNSADVLRSFVKQNPDSNFTAIARQRIQVLEQQEKVRLTAQQERIRWEIASGSSNLSLVEDYLAMYPDGRFRRPALSLEKKLKAVEVAKAEATGQRVAVLSPATTATSVGSEPQSDPKDDRDLVRGIQEQLNRIGCSVGEVDGVWGNGSERGLQNYAKHDKVKLASFDPSENLLDMLGKEKRRVCPLVCSRRHVAKGNRCILKTCNNGKQLNRSGNCVGKAKESTNSENKKSANIGKSKKDACGRCIINGGKAYVCRRNGDYWVGAENISNRAMGMKCNF